MTYVSSTNKERTTEYLSKFNRETVLKYLIKENAPIIFDIGANDGLSLEEFKTWWRNSIVHCFEPQEECLDILIKRSKSYKKSSVIISYLVENLIHRHDSPSKKLRELLLLLF